MALRRNCTLPTQKVDDGFEGQCELIAGCRCPRVVVREVVTQLNPSKFRKTLRVTYDFFGSEIGASVLMATDAVRTHVAIALFDIGIGAPRGGPSARVHALKGSR